MSNLKINLLIVFMMIAALSELMSAQGTSTTLDASESIQTTRRTGTATDQTLRQDQQTWTNWSEWTTCSSTTMPGFRIRSRFCPKQGNCPGDDVKIKKCNSHDPLDKSSRYKFSRKYIDHCKNLGTGKSLSCRLYLENPDLAYDIFRQNSCFFTVNEDETGDGSPSEDDTFPNLNSSDSKNGNDSDEFSLNSKNGSSFIDEDEVSHESNSEKERKNEEKRKAEDDDDNTSNYSSYTINVIRALIEERKCKAHCDNTMKQAARLWAMGTNNARSAETTVALLSRNNRLSTGVGVMFYEYNSCLRKCNSLGITFSFLSGREKTRNENLTTDIKKLMGMLDNDASTGNEENLMPEVPSLCGGNPPKCLPQPKSGTMFPSRSIRRKRQVSERYKSACFSTEDPVPVREIERKARAELYFFESYVQRFTSRKCKGTKRGETGLYMPKERVLQQRNDEPAYCRQGFLTRHALFIVENPRGRYKFSTGEKFDIQSRTFDVESHCEIVILK